MTTPTPETLPVAPPPNDNRRRLRELLSVPERDRTDEQWDEIIELEIQLAPGNRISGNEPSLGGGGGGHQQKVGGQAQKKHRPRSNNSNSNSNNSSNNNRRPRQNKPSGGGSGGGNPA